MPAAEALRSPKPQRQAQADGDAHGQDPCNGSQGPLGTPAGYNLLRTAMLQTAQFSE